MRFTVFEVEGHSNCEYDIIRIVVDGVEQGNGFCSSAGKIPEPDQLFTGSEIRILLDSDGSVNEAGFEIFITFDPNNTPPPPTTAPPAGSYDLIPGVTCGVHTNPTSSNSKIVGGSNAALGQFRWQAFFSPCGSDGCFICGATIISNRWLVSAAHCSEGSIATQSTVRIGTLYRTSGGVLHNLDTIINHNNFGSVTQGNDISLLRTSDEMIFNDNAFPLSSSRRPMLIHWLRNMALRLRNDLIRWEPF